MFKSLSDTETGKWLVDYLTRLQTKVCDVRYSDMPAEPRIIAADIINDEIIEKLTLQNKKSKQAINEWS